MTPLDRLESRSLRVLREARACLPRLAMLWSVGKDSTALLHLTRKAFLGRVPFPLIHVDTSYKIPEMLAYRDRLAREWGLTILVARADADVAAGRTFPRGGVDRLECCRRLKTNALADVLSGRVPRRRLDARTGELVPWADREPFLGAFAGIRADEEGTRSKERVFSPRGPDGRWDVSAQPAELWDQFQTDAPAGTHVRVHPLLEWRESDVWEYVAREKIATVGLYFDRGDGRRYRSLGCAPCTGMVASTASTPQEIVAELRTGQLRNRAEREGRAQDAADRGTLETLRREGYM